MKNLQKLHEAPVQVQDIERDVKQTMDLPDYDRLIEEASINEQRRLRNEALELQNDKQRSELKDLSQDRMLRGCFSVFIVVAFAIYLGILFRLIEKTGNYNLQNHLPFISDKVMIALLTTTTIQFFLLIRVMARYVFSKKIF